MKVTITKERLEQLEDIENKMNCLERGGVDNWSSYGEALEEYFKEKEFNEFVKDRFEGILIALSFGVFEPSEKGAGFSFTSSSEQEAFVILKEIIEKIREGK